MGASSLGPGDASAVIAGWHARPTGTRTMPAANALTVDVEDYFQVEAFYNIVDRNSWNSYPCRVEQNVDRILELFENAGVRATFFTLAWIAKRYPAIVKKIVAGGHELASHGTDHQRADHQTRTQFQNDIASAKAILEDLSGVEIKGFRAPSFSIGRKNLWAMEAIADAGYKYSSSTYPIVHDNYGIPEGPRFAFYPLCDRSLLEIPVTSLRWLGRNWPCGGGGYFRLLPYELSAFALNQVRRHDGEPLVFYFHPWEIDAEQPRLPHAQWKSRARHYLNLDRTMPRLARLVSAFQWARMDEIFLTDAPKGTE